MANEVDYNPCQYLGNGQTRDFSFNWKVIEVDELIVELEAVSTGTITRLARGVDYTANINAVGGNVTLVSAPSEDYYIYISRKTSNYQSKGYSTSTGFQGSEIEKSFDKVSCCLQDMEYNIETFKSNFSAEVNSAITEFETEVNSNIETISNSVDSANTTASNAVSIANEATATANSASSKADTAISTANIANSKADNAVSTSNTAQSTANNALTSATNAVDTANSASTTATNASNKVDTLEENIETVIEAAEKINELEEAVTTATTAAINASESAQTASDKADIATQKAQEAVETVDGMAKNDLSNLTEEGYKVISNNGGVPPQALTNAKVYADGTSFKLLFADPDNITAGGYNFYEWQKTVIVAKIGSYPTSPTDGEVVITETTKNSYSSTYLSWTPQNYDDYYFKAFVYSTKGYYNSDVDNQFSALAPAAISNGLTHKTSSGYQLKWSDPSSGELLSWAATYIIRKEGSYPTSITDGTQVLKSTTRNAYASNPYLDMVPDITKNYYYRAFTYSSNNLYNTDISQQFSELIPNAATNCYVDNTSNNQAELIWEDSADYTFCTWAKTVIVRSETAIPQSVNDGDIIYTETVKNSHIDNTNPYIDTTADLSKTYYYKAFPCSTNGVYNTASPVFEYGSIYTEIYEFIINTAESDPTAAVTYVGSNASFTPASMDFTTGQINYGSWGNAFFQPRPVMVRYDGTVDYELSKSDFTKKKDGVTASDVDNTSYDGNCMIAFPQIWMKFAEDDSKHQHVYIANSQIDNDYHCYTHQNKNGVMLDEIFIMAFEPSNISNKLRSLAGQNILRSLSGETMQTYAKANGSSWDFMDFGEIQMLQMLCILMFKSLDSQGKIGAGVVYSSNSDTTYATTGSTKDKGMFYAICNDPDSTSATTAIKVFGIENLWGNRSKWFNGFVITSTSNGSQIKYKLCDYTTDGTTVAAYSQAGTGYKVLASAPASDVLGYAQKMYLNSDGLFPYPNIGYIGSGSATTYYCDRQYLYKATTYDRFAAFGCYYNNNANAGLFYVYINNQLSYNHNNFGASLSCKPIS